MHGQSVGDARFYTRSGPYGLAEVAAVLGGTRPDGAGPGPKVHVDPRR